MASRIRHVFDQKDLKVLSRLSFDKFERNQERLDKKVKFFEGQDLTLDELIVKFLKNSFPL